MAKKTRKIAMCAATKTRRPEMTAWLVAHKEACPAD
jgi:hypothetical protein